jgi:hypothetical protein
MRALQAAVILMGVLILGGTAALIGIVVHRATLPGHARAPASAAAGAPASVVLNEPDGTRIAAMSAASDRLVLHLIGGGPERVVVLALPGGAVVARVALAH